MHQRTLYLEDPVTDVLTYALQRTIDDLAARAIIAERTDPEIGPLSAEEYRADIRRLESILCQIGGHWRGPDPERAAVSWIDGVYTIADGQPLRMVSEAQLYDALASALGLDSTVLGPRGNGLARSVRPHEIAAR